MDKLAENVPEHFCEICKKTFKTKLSLRNHSNIQHGEMRFICEYCTKGFAFKYMLIVHERKHTGERPYICTDCDKRFATKCNLKQHILNHTSEKHKMDELDENVPEHVCEICKTAYKTKQSLRTHLNKYHGKKKFFCKYCTEGFAFEYMLKVHNRINHTEEQKQFATSSSLKQHNILIDTAENPHESGICDKSFGQLSTLQYHLRTHTEENPHKSHNILQSVESSDSDEINVVD